MLAIERRREILERLRIDGKVLVSELAKAFDVTEETVRRDLEKLDKEGLVSNVDLSRLKVGKSYKTNILKLIEIGDAGISAAAKNGHITKIHYVETKKNKVFIPLLFFPIHVDKVETVVYGE